MLICISSSHKLHERCIIKVHKLLQNKGTFASYNLMIKRQPAYFLAILCHKWHKIFFGPGTFGNGIKQPKVVSGINLPTVTTETKLVHLKYFKWSDSQLDIFTFLGNTCASNFAMTDLRICSSTLGKQSGTWVGCLHSAPEAWVHLRAGL